MNKMFITRYIQNYYETHGNFDGLNYRIIGMLQKLSGSSISLDGAPGSKGYAALQQLCFSLLGYPKGVMKIKTRTHWQMDNAEWSALQSVNLDAVKNEVAEFSLPPKKVYRNLKVRKEMLNAITALTWYYMNTNDIIVTDDKTTLSLYDFVTYYKLASSQKVDGVVQEKASTSKKIETLIALLAQKKALVTFVESEEMKITNKTFFCSGFSEKEQEKIQKEAITNLFNGLYLRAGVLAQRLALLTLGVDSPQVYTAILDMCRGLGITYAEYAKMYGIQITDQSQDALDCGVIYHVVGDDTYFVDTQGNPDVPISRVKSDTFEKLICSGEIGGRV